MTVEKMEKSCKSHGARDCCINAKTFKGKGVRIKKITIENDSTTIARARTEMDASLM